MTRVAIAAVLTLALSFGLQAASRVDDSGLEAKIDLLFRDVSNRQLPGAAVAVVRDNEIVLLKGYGLADIEGETPITPQTVFQIGSITKSFTALAILQLHEEGRLDIDHPIAEYLPDFPRGDRIRIRHLLSHTAGVPDFLSYEQAKTQPLEFEPGQRINYSNTGYQMLGKIIERVSGQSYRDYLQAAIFSPARMTRSGCGDFTKATGRATGYLLKPGGTYERVPPDDAAGAFAAGAIYSTVEDMAHWAQAIADNRLVGAETLDLALQPVRLSQGRQTVYGFGWMLRNWRGLREAGHGGDITGFNSYFARFPGHNTTIIVLSNTGMQPRGPLPAAGDLAHGIAEICLAGFVQQPELPVPVAVPPDVLESYLGRYELQAPEPVVQQSGRFINIVRKDDQLATEINGMTIPLAARRERTFDVVGSPVGASLTFVPGAGGRASEMIVNLMGLREYVARRVD